MATGTEHYGVIARVLRRFSPQLLQAVICLGALPLIFALSLAAGVIVWTTASVGWEAPVYLQYGYVRHNAHHTLCVSQHMCQ